MRQKVIDAIMVYAAAEYPCECYGVMAQKSKMRRYVPCRNLAIDLIEHFHPSPEDHIAVED